MTMRSYEDQIWREDQWYARSCLADGLAQLAEATGDYEAIGANNGAV